MSYTQYFYEGSRVILEADADGGHYGTQYLQHKPCQLGGRERITYCVNNPLRYTDPSGYSSGRCCGLSGARWLAVSAQSAQSLAGVESRWLMALGRQPGALQRRW